MKPLKQRMRHDPGNGVWGDCHRAAIASALELPLDEVPHFAENYSGPEEFGRREAEFLRSRGLIRITVPFKGDLLDVLSTTKATNPDVYYLFGGESRTGVDHTVVGLNDELVHDPSLNGSGIIGPCGDGFYWVTFFGSIVAAKRDPTD